MSGPVICGIIGKGCEGGGSGGNPDRLLLSQNFTTQGISGLNVDTQVAFGAPVSQTNVSLDISGTITFNTVGYYRLYFGAFASQVSASGACTYTVFVEDDSGNRRVFSAGIGFLATNTGNTITDVFTFACTEVGQTLKYFAVNKTNDAVQLQLKAAPDSSGGSSNNESPSASIIIENAGIQGGGGGNDVVGEPPTVEGNLSEWDNVTASKLKDSGIASNTIVTADRPTDDTIFIPEIINTTGKLGNSKLVRPNFVTDIQGQQIDIIETSPVYINDLWAAPPSSSSLVMQWDTVNQQFQMSNVDRGGGTLETGTVISECYAIINGVPLSLTGTTFDLADGETKYISSGTSIRNSSFDMLTEHDQLISGTNIKMFFKSTPDSSYTVQIYASRQFNPSSLKTGISFKYFATADIN